MSITSAATSLAVQWSTVQTHKLQATFLPNKFATGQIAIVRLDVQNASSINFTALRNSVD
jgi:hypothetical protein